MSEEIFDDMELIIGDPPMEARSEHVIFKDGFTLIIIDDTIFDPDFRVTDVIADVMKDENKEAYLMIQSTGGSVFNLMLFINLLKRYKKVTSVNLGIAFSSAAMLFLMADERYVTELSAIMLHDITYPISGRRTDVRSFDKFMGWMLKTLNRDIPLDTVVDDTYYTSTELIKLKVAKRAPKALFKKLL